MDEPLLTCADREQLREFAVHQMRHRPGLLERGAAVADQFRRLVPSLADEQLAAVTALCASITGQAAHTGGCAHTHRIALLLQAAVADLAHLELDPPDAQ